MTNINEHDILFEETDVTDFLARAKQSHQSVQIAQEEISSAHQQFIARLEKKKAFHFNFELRPLATAALFVFCFCGGAFAYNMFKKSHQNAKFTFYSTSKLAEITQIAAFSPFQDFANVFKLESSKIEESIFLGKSELDQSSELSSVLSIKNKKQVSKAGLTKKNQANREILRETAVKLKSLEDFKQAALKAIALSEKADFNDPIHYKAGEMAALIGYTKKAERAFVKALATSDAQSAMLHLKRMILEGSLKQQSVLEQINTNSVVRSQVSALQLKCGWALSEQNFALLDNCEDFVKKAPHNPNAITYIVSAGQLVEHQKRDYAHAARLYNYAILYSDIPSTFSKQALLGRVNCLIKMENLDSAKKDFKKLLILSQGRLSPEVVKIKEKLGLD